MENLNIALIRCGHDRPSTSAYPEPASAMRIVAVCDVFAEGAKKGAEIAGAGAGLHRFNEAINDPDVNAVVVTPGPVPQGSGSGSGDPGAGKPVFSEKPLANTADGKGDR